jgi:hypothetical protein
MTQQEQIIRSFPEKLMQIPENAVPLFGKMNPRQMAEHMAEYIRLAYGNPEVSEIFYTEESVNKLQDFLRSDRPFKDNTPNPLMPESPMPPRFPDYHSAVADVAAAVRELFNAFEQHPTLKVQSPFFGILDKELTFHLLAKHATHHLRQFQ